MHYRTQSTFSLKQAKAANVRMKRIIRAVHLAQQQLCAIGKSYKFPLLNLQQTIIRDNILVLPKLHVFLKHLADELNTPRAIASMNSTVETLNNSKHIVAVLNTVIIELQILGLVIPELSNKEIVMVNNMVEIRQQLREQQLFKQADNIRKFLQQQGYIIEDSVKTILYNT